VAVAVEFGRAGGGWAGGIVFNLWLRRRLRERRMSQRQLAAYSGVSHSTISRLLSGNSTPSLETATRLAHTLRQLGGSDNAAAYFDRVPDEAAMFPINRVQAALLADEALDDQDVQDLMQAYLLARARRRRPRVVAGRPCSPGPGARHAPSPAGRISSAKS